MENQNTQTGNQQTAAPTPQPNPNVAPKPSFLSNLKTSPVVQNISNKFNAFTPSQQRLIKIGGGIFAFAIVLLIVGSIIKSLKPAKPSSTPIPTPAALPPLPTPAGIGIPSRYATDSAVLKIDADVKSLQTKLEGTDLDESNLKPPTINFFVSFSQ